jgi:hypothetical protein
MIENQDTSIDHVNDAAAIPSDDLANFDTSDIEGTMEVRNPYTGEVLRHPPDENNPDGRPMTITFLSKDSDTFVNLSLKQQDRRNAQMIRTRQAALASTNAKDDVELLVAVTRRWDIRFDGKVLASKPEEYRKLYSNPKFRWLRTDADNFVGNLANFSRTLNGS